MRGTTTVVSDETGDPDPQLFERFQASIGSHPVVQHVARTGDGRPRTISDFLTEDEFHATQLYQDFYRHIGAEDQLSCALPDASVVVGIALNRDARSFTLRERTILNLCRPYLVRARRTALAYERTQWYLGTLEHLAERRGEGLILIATGGRTVFASPHGTALVRRWFGAPDLPEAVLARLADSPQPLGIRHQRRVLDVDRLPGPDAETAAVLLRESGPSPGDVDALRRLGLTAREAETLVHVTLGRTNAAIAAELGISTRTVEKHLQLTMHKLGVTNRVQAAALVRDGRLPAPSDPISS